MEIKPLRIIFMGTPDFSVPALHTLVAAGHKVIAVYSQPPRPAGRGQQLQKSPVQLAAEEMNISVHTPLNFKDAADVKIFADYKADMAVVAAYGLILPKAILDAPCFGCINIHASLLPRWRGAAPIQRAMLAGDVDTGISIMQMEAGLDTGPVWLKRSVPITTQTTASTLHDELSALGAAMMAEAIPLIAEEKTKPQVQTEAGATYAAKLTKDEGRINWHESAVDIERKIRVLNPWPGVFFESRGGRIKVLAARLVMGKQGVPATLLGDDFTVACGEDALQLVTVQRQGRATMDGAAFLRGFPIKLGDAL